MIKYTGPLVGSRYTSCDDMNRNYSIYRWNNHADICLRGAWPYALKRPATVRSLFEAGADEGNRPSGDMIYRYIATSVAKEAFEHLTGFVFCSLPYLVWRYPAGIITDSRVMQPASVLQPHVVVWSLCVEYETWM